MNAFVVVDIVKHCAQVSHHECVGSENGDRSGRGSIDRQKGADSMELAVDFFFLDVEKASDMLDHLFVRESHLIAGGAVWRRRGNDVGGVAHTVCGGGRARGNENGGGQARHCRDGWAVVGCMESKKGVCMVDTKRAVDWRGLRKVLESQYGGG